MVKLALAVGDKRHYVIDTIMPRHFIQTAVRNGMPAAAVEEVYAELAEGAEAAIGRTYASLADDFPAAIVESITGGMRTRLRLLETRCSSTR